MVNEKNQHLFSWRCTLQIQFKTMHKNPRHETPNAYHNNSTPLHRCSNPATTMHNAWNCSSSRAVWIYHAHLRFDIAPCPTTFATGIGGICATCYTNRASRVKESNIAHHKPVYVCRFWTNAAAHNRPSIVFRCCCLNLVNGCNSSREYPASGTCDNTCQNENKKNTIDAEIERDIL